MDRHPTSMRMRPVYQWTTEGTPTEFIARLTQVCSFDPSVRIQHSSTHALLGIPAEARHTWSPTLDVSARERGDGTLVFARLGPEPPVWTFFVFCYAATTAVALFGLILGFSQYTLGQTAWGLLAVPIWLVVCGGIYAASFIGRGLGANQIHQLLACAEASLGEEGRPFEGD